MGDRDTILGCADPTQLFGTAEPRALRKAYAALARVWRDDDVVASHLKALFDRARTLQVYDTEASPDGDPEPPPPANPVEALQRAMREGDPHRVVRELLFGYRLLVEHAPEQVVPCLTFAVHAYGEALTAAERNDLSQVIEDPLLGLEGGLLHRLGQALTTLEELERLEVDPELPPAIGACLRASWGHPPEDVARCWLDAAEVLRARPLRPAFVRLEHHSPACFGRWVWPKTVLARTAEKRSPVPTPLPDGLKERYASSRGRATAADAPAWAAGLGRLPMLGGLDLGSRRALFFAWLVIVAVGVLAAMKVVDPLRTRHLGLWLFGSWTLLVGAPLAMHGSLRRLHTRRAREASEGSLRPLFDVARQTARFPRELARELYDTPSLSRQIRGYDDQHAVLRLEQCPWGQLEVITEAHVARLEAS